MYVMMNSQSDFGAFQSRYAYPRTTGYNGGYFQGDIYNSMDMQAQYAMHVQQMQWQQQQQLRQQAMRCQQAKSSEAFHKVFYKRLGGIENGATDLQGLNREEFIDVNRELNALTQTLARYSADGNLSAQERSDLLQRRARLQAKLEHYKKTDCKPLNPTHDPLAQRDTELLGSLYDQQKSQKINSEEAREILQQLSLAGQQEAVDEVNHGWVDPGAARERRELLFSLLA